MTFPGIDVRVIDQEESKLSRRFHELEKIWRKKEKEEEKFRIPIYIWILIQLSIFFLLFL